MYRCPLCGRLFKRVVDLIVHFRVHARGLACPCCGYTAARHHGLMTHIIAEMRSGDHCHALAYLALSNGRGRSREARRRARELLEALRA